MLNYTMNDTIRNKLKKTLFVHVENNSNRWAKRGSLNSKHSIMHSNWCKELSENNEINILQNWKGKVLGDKKREK